MDSAVIHLQITMAAAARRRFVLNIICCFARFGFDVRVCDTIIRSRASLSFQNSFISTLFDRQKDSMLIGQTTAHCPFPSELSTDRRELQPIFGIDFQIPLHNFLISWHIVFMNFNLSSGRTLIDISPIPEHSIATSIWFRLSSFLFSFESQTCRHKTSNCSTHCASDDASIVKYSSSSSFFPL